MAEDAVSDSGRGRNVKRLAVASEQDDAKRPDDRIAELERKVGELQAELGRVRNSLSWRVTQPLRTLARRLPRAAALGQRGLDRAKDGLVAVLPRTAVRTLMDNRWDVPADIEDRISLYRARDPSRARKLVVYTAIFGETDNLLLPERIEPEVDYVCFTDRPRNDYGVWQIRAAPYHHPDPTRVARWIKTHPHDLFPDHETAVWLDANIILKGDVRAHAEKVARNGADLGLVPHPHRSCFYDEAEACKRLKKDSAKIIDIQVARYREGGLPESQPLFETGFMVVPLRREGTATALHDWWQEIERFSRRDQLALAWVLHVHPGLRIAPLLPQGASVRDHEDFRYFRHNYARALIVPEVLQGLGQVSDPLEAPIFAEVKDRRLDRVADVPVDIVVCVHNALEDVRLCLESAWDCLRPGHRLILVNDLSDEATTAYLRDFAAGRPSVTLIENEQNLGYTRSANRGLAAGTAPFRIMLNSDTIVSPNWALKLLDTARSSDRIGIVGPLSNAAGAQSIPRIKNTGDNTAINPLPNGLGPADLDLACEAWSLADPVPRVPLVHGFCLGVRSEVIDAIGLFDEENFKLFYGEENDYCLRARAAGFELAVATNTFVFHRKSRSIDAERRVVQMAEAWKRLRDLYGAERILAAHRQVEEHPLLERMRRRADEHFKLFETKAQAKAAVGAAVAE
jgi:GT2 family glycosyltransferase